MTPSQDETVKKKLDDIHQNARKTSIEMFQKYERTNDSSDLGLYIDKIVDDVLSSHTNRIKEGVEKMRKQKQVPPVFDTSEIYNEALDDVLSLLKDTEV